MRGATQECYAPLGSPPGLVAVAADEESPLERLAPRLNALPQSKLLPRESVEEIAKLAQSSLFTPGASEKQPLLPPALRPGPGSAARFVLLYSVLTWLATFVLNFPWLPVLLWADYGAPILRGRVPVYWVYLQTLNFVFWNVLAVVCSDDYCTHDAVDALRRLGVPHNRQSLAYRIACGWWPRDFWNRCLYVTLAWTGLFGGVPLIAFLITPPYHKEQASKTAFVLFVTLWSSGVGAALSTLVCVRAAGEGTSSPFYVRTNPRVCFQPAVHKLAWRWSGVEHEITAITRPLRHQGSGGATDAAPSMQQSAEL